MENSHPTATSTPGDHNRDASRPPGTLLTRYCEHHPVRLALGAAARGEAGLIGDTATRRLGTVEMGLCGGARDSRRAHSNSGDHRGRFRLARCHRVGLERRHQRARGREIRNGPLCRWPTLPKEEPDSEGKVGPARTPA